MFDTVKLEVNGSFIISETGLNFKVFQNTGKFRKRYLNPDAKFVEKYGYHPKITLYEFLFNHGWVVRRFEIEGSLPKMVWSSSYYGLDENDIDLIIDTIIDKLKTFGLDCSADDVEKGNVVIVAYGFNFYLLPQYARGDDRRECAGTVSFQRW